MLFVLSVRLVCRIPISDRQHLEYQTCSVPLLTSLYLIQVSLNLLIYYTYAYNTFGSFEFELYFLSILIMKMQLSFKTPTEKCFDKLFECLYMVFLHSKVTVAITSVTEEALLSDSIATALTRGADPVSCRCCGWSRKQLDFRKKSQPLPLETGVSRPVSRSQHSLEAFPESLSPADARWGTFNVPPSDNFLPRNPP